MRVLHRYCLPFRGSFLRRVRPGVVMGLSLATAVALEAAAAPHLSWRRVGMDLELRWPTEAGFLYGIETKTDLAGATWEPYATNLVGTGDVLQVQDVLKPGGRRFYRAVRQERPGPQISPQAVEVSSGEVYPAGTQLGSTFLGRQFTVPPRWKAGMREGEGTLLVVSDEEPGMVVALTTLAGTASAAARQLGQDFYVGEFGGFAAQGSPLTTERGFALEWWGLGFTDAWESLEGVRLRGEAVAHPSGGSVIFIGLFTETNRAVMQRVLTELIQSTIVVPRQTRTDLVNLIAGKSFLWVKSTSTGSGGNSGSLQRWTERNAFFCPGTYEITTRSESSFSGNLSGGGFYTGSSSSQSTEAGDWTIIETPAGPALVMLSNAGGQAALIRIEGNSVIFGEQQFDFRAPHACSAP